MLKAVILHNPKEISIHVRLSGHLWECAGFQGGTYIASNYYPAELCGSLQAVGMGLTHLTGEEIYTPVFTGYKHLQDWAREVLGLEVAINPRTLQ